ncbi:MAG: hypothetical protein KAQ63_01605 [Candidatus Moranbacteria bacterium]|nr:hypothetical protein [Candidatus Moranbacteria bacterium]
MVRLRLENKKNGYIALMGVLVVGAAGLATALYIILSGTDSIRTTFSIEQSVEARGIANACIEESLREIQESVSFEGTGSLSLGNGECFFEVSKGVGLERTVEATGVVDETVRRVKVEIDTVRPRINVNTWQEVKDF